MGRPVKLDYRRYAPFIVLGLCGLTLLHVLLIWTGSGTGASMIEDRVLLDTDAYMWMNRVTYIHESGDWFEHIYPRVNPPEGHEQHWTRPLDAVLLGGGRLLGAAVGFEAGLFYWAFVVPPLLHLLTLILLCWAIKPLVEKSAARATALPILVLVFLSQFAIYQPFLAGRPDHHGPLAALFMLYLGLWFRVLLRERGDEKSAVGLGIVAALAVWVNVESMIFVTLGMAGLGIAWLAGRKAMARLALIHAAVLCAASGAALLAEWGFRGWPVREMDALSMAHVTLFALCTGFWALTWFSTPKTTGETFRGRLLVAVSGAIGVFGILLLSFPEFYGSPLASVDELYATTRLSLIEELQPLAWAPEGVLAGVGMLLWLACAPLVALPYAVVRTARAGDHDVRVVWGFLAAGIAAYLVLALGQRRWVDYLALVSVIPYGLLAHDVVKAVEAGISERRIRIVRPLALLALLLGPALLGGGVKALGGADPVGGPEWESGAALAMELGRDLRWAGEDSDERLAARPECSLAELSEPLTDERWFAEPRLVLAHTDLGPEILYRTHHDVLSIPNHRFQPGYHFMHEVMESPDPERATALLHERGVGVILLCRSDLTSGFFHYPEVVAPFALWLAEGGVPDGYILHTSSRWVRVYRSVR